MEIFIISDIRGREATQILQPLFFKLHIIPFTILTE